MNAALRERLAPLQRHWHALPAREQRAVGLALVVVALALVWWIALAPALATLREAPAQHRTLDAQLQHMRTLQAQARTMQSLPRLERAEAQRALEAATARQLGTSGRLEVHGDSATLTLQGARGDALAQWLAQARINARAVPLQAHLQRNLNGLWDGNLELALAPR